MFRNILRNVANKHIFIKFSDTFVISDLRNLSMKVLTQIVRVVAANFPSEDLLTDQIARHF